MGVSIYLSTEQIHALQQMATYLDYNGGDEKVLRETNNLVNLYSEIEKKIFKAQQRSNNLKAAKKIIKNKGFWPFYLNITRWFMKRIKALTLSGNAKQRRKIVRRFNRKNKPFAIMKQDQKFGSGDYVIFQKDIDFGET